MKIHSSVLELLHKDRRTDRHTERFWKVLSVDATARDKKTRREAAAMFKHYADFAYEEEVPCIPQLCITCSRVVSFTLWFALSLGKNILKPVRFSRWSGKLQQTNGKGKNPSCAGSQPKADRQSGSHFSDRLSGSCHNCRDRSVTVDSWQRISPWT